MAALWTAVGILGVLVIALGIMIYLKFFKRRTVLGMLERQVEKLQDKDVKREEELELRKFKRQLESSIATKEKEIKDLKGGK